MRYFGAHGQIEGICPAITRQSQTGKTAQYVMTLNTPHAVDDWHPLAIGQYMPRHLD